MCINPSHIWIKRGPEYKRVPVPCDACKLCHRNYVDDWVGRCLCEAAYSTRSCTVSLTYAPPKNPNDLSHKIINPYHFQLFMKALRNSGHKVRYLVAGEYGGKKGRAHFHAILFFQKLETQENTAPWYNWGHQEDLKSSNKFSEQVPQDVMCHIQEWPHGHILCDWSASERSIKYCCEYLTIDRSRSWFSMSKKPPLGAAFFAEKAKLYVNNSVLPKSFEYLPPGGMPGKKYLMTGATRREFMNAITRARVSRPRMSKWVGRTFDKLERDEFKHEANTGDLAEQIAQTNENILARHKPLEKQMRQMKYAIDKSELDAQALVDRIEKQVADEWGFDDVEEFQGFCDNYGPSTRPELWRGSRNLHNSASSRDAGGGTGGASRPPSRVSVIGGAKRPPDTFDRQGKPEYQDRLSHVFDRDRPGRQADD